VIPVGSTLIFYPVIQNGAVEAGGTIKATNDLGAFIDYSWTHKGAIKQTCEFFCWDELQRYQIKSIGGVCE
jgi:hypothetical protein